jgi:hypothetical protein
LASSGENALRPSTYDSGIDDELMELDVQSSMTLGGLRCYWVEKVLALQYNPE